MKFQYPTTLSSWSTANSRNAAMRHFYGTGNVPTTITAGGQNTPGAQSGVTEIFDGTSWTEVSDLNTARAYAGMSSATEEWSSSSNVVKTITTS